MKVTDEDVERALDAYDKGSLRAAAVLCRDGMRAALESFAASQSQTNTVTDIKYPQPASHPGGIWYCDQCGAPNVVGQRQN